MTLETLQKANDLNERINQLVLATEYMTCKDDKKLTIKRIEALENEFKQL